MGIMKLHLQASGLCSNICDCILYKEPGFNNAVSYFLAKLLHLYLPSYKETNLSVSRYAHITNTCLWDISSS
jgi:hypothetical protein